jgi:hypothetical protein
MNDSDKQIETKIPNTFSDFKSSDVNDVSCQSLEELKALKRDWYRHFLSVLEKLADNIDSVSSEFYNYKESIYKEINAAKELFRKEIELAKSKGDLDIEKLESRFDRSITSLYKIIESLDSSKDIDSLKLEIINVKHDLTVRIDETVLSIHEHHDSDFRPISNEVTIIKTKLSVWIFIAGLFISGFVSVTIWLLKDYIKKIICLFV